MAIIFAVVCLIGYAMWVFILPAIVAAVFHLWAIIDAAKYQNSSEY